MITLIKRYAHSRIGTIILAVCGILQVALPGEAPAQEDSYPRIGAMLYSCACAEWAQKYDLLVLNTGNDFAQRLKTINPDIKLLYMIDWNVAAHLGYGIPDNFRLKTVDGSPIGFYGGFIVNPAGSQIAPNFSDVCPLIDGKRANQWFAEYITVKVDMNYFDGLATDGFWGGSGVDNIPSSIPLDMDVNGVSDWVEHDRPWIKSRWDAGASEMLRLIRQKLGPDKLIVINSGWGFGDHPAKQYINGAIIEYEGDENNPNNKLWEYRNFMQYSAKPQATVFPACHMTQNPFSRDVAPKNNFKFMRFGLTKVLLGDGYYGYTDRYNPGHLNTKWYDEFEADLGYPVTDMAQLNGTDVWVRFFDNGCSICNLTGQEVRITDADLQSMTGYDGPYYRFYGGQVPEFNNGQRFTDVTLFGGTYNENWGAFLLKYTGDGIVLLKEPVTIVSDIVIDNDDVTTSPGSPSTEYVGSWTTQFEDHDSYAVCVAPAVNFSGYACTGVEDVQAVFRPTIGIAGQYMVYEWHGYHTGQEATNAKYIINHAGGSLLQEVNQQADQGQWNLLGTFFFNKGTTGNVTISSKGHNGTVIADAVKFVYQGSSTPDTVPPNTPGNLRSDQCTDNRILLAWDAPQAASDGDVALFYSVYRDGEFLGSTKSLSYLDEDVVENMSYTYFVFAVDDAGNLSSASASVVLQTLIDQIPPTLDSIEALGLTDLRVTFSEKVTETSSENPGNYTVESGVTVYSADLQSDFRTVRLVTSTHNIGLPYTLVVNNVRDRSSLGNAILPNSTIDYAGNGGDITVTIAADDVYQLYLNGALLGSGSNWNLAESYSGPSIAGKNVIAVKGTDMEGLAGIVVKIEFNGELYVSDNSWRVSTSLENGWETVDYDDQDWPKATSFGEHGTALPWADYADVIGMSTNEGVEWIWSNDNDNDNTVYLRFTIRPFGDMIPPSAPTGLRRK
ncbi:hypothetical protein JXO52_17430 [bacterium]|nr:hypothetical protein [bacterium]